jgi:hypothetical protein
VLISENLGIYKRSLFPFKCDSYDFHTLEKMQCNYYSPPQVTVNKASYNYNMQSPC